MVRRSLFRSLLCLALLLAGCASYPPPGTIIGKGPDIVVLVHGFDKDWRAMGDMADYLRTHGYRVISLDYPTRSLRTGPILAIMAGELKGCCADARRVDFVGHSFGGIMIRDYLARHHIPNLGRVVLIATPSRGSEFADFIENDVPWLKKSLGPLLAQMGTGPDDVPAKLPPPYYPVGVIAGDLTHNPLGAWILPGPDDGAVSVASTRFKGMTDFVVVPANHFWLRHDPRVFADVLNFLRKGQFLDGEIAKRKAAEEAGETAAR